MTQKRKTSALMQDATDILDPATGMVRADAVKSKIDHLRIARLQIEAMVANVPVWISGLSAANGWNNTEAADALGITVNRVGQLLGMKSAATEREVVTILDRMLLIDVDTSLPVIEISRTPVTPIRQESSKKVSATA
jgi:hypothetical protein